MPKTKDVIKDFMTKAGTKDTTMHESIAPSVQHERVKPSQHEEVNTAIDREIHQDHYQQKVQPIHDKEILPERHTDKVGAVQEREFDHRDKEATRRARQAEAQKYNDQRIVEETKYSQSQGPTVAGEHVHHHVHERIQPVVHKETIQPNVVHTTVPIHEVHHQPEQLHSETSLPSVSMDEYKRQGGALGGRHVHTKAFEGEPILEEAKSSSHKRQDSAKVLDDVADRGYTDTPDRGHNVQRKEVAVDRGHNEQRRDSSDNESHKDKEPSLLERWNPLSSKGE
ncbi:hypothetical protein F4778DRAFT_787135 [Xylariomycetidae sp. FL2044]|nr:hypothetical protein F4778DRAFT_787130 [Xylariomycetidae sp. FL2044]KAH9885741.1 hypothetical protein F4778DRAFT_787135 [Xylariomycetidae sp. FL2044]